MAEVEDLLRRRYGDQCEVFRTAKIIDLQPKGLSKNTAARRLQRSRFEGTKTYANSAMEPAQMRKCCALDEAGNDMMKAAFQAMNLTARSYDRVLRVARTIADLAGSETIHATHIAEAVQYRTFQLTAND